MAFAKGRSGMSQPKALEDVYVQLQLHCVMYIMSDLLWAGWLAALCFHNFRGGVRRVRPPGRLAHAISIASRALPRAATWEWGYLWGCASTRCTRVSYITDTCMHTHNFCQQERDLHSLIDWYYKCKRACVKRLGASVLLCVCLATVSYGLKGTAP